MVLYGAPCGLIGFTKKEKNCVGPIGYLFFGSAKQGFQEIVDLTLDIFGQLTAHEVWESALFQDDSHLNPAQEGWAELAMPEHSQAAKRTGSAKQQFPWNPTASQRQDIQVLAQLRQQREISCFSIQTL